MLDDGTLEQVTDPKEQADKASQKEPEGQVSEGQEKVSGEKSKEDIATETKAAADSLAVEAYMKTPAYEKAIQSQADKSIHSQTQPLRERIAELEKSDAEKALAAKEAKQSKQWEEEGIPAEAIKDFHTEGRAQAEAGRILNASLAKHNSALQKLHAWELSRETGVDMKELLKCKTLEEMDTKAQELAGKAKDDELVSLREETKAAKEAATKAQQIDSGGAGVVGVDLSNLSPEEKITAAIQMAKNK